MFAYVFSESKRMYGHLVLIFALILAVVSNLVTLFFGEYASFIYTIVAGFIILVFFMVFIDKFTQDQFGRGQLDLSAYTERPSKFSIAIPQAFYLLIALLIMIAATTVLGLVLSANNLQLNITILIWSIILGCTAFLVFTVLNRGALMQANMGDWVIVLFMLLLIATCFLPVMNVVARSLSYPGYIMRRQVAFLPMGFHMSAYMEVLNDSRFMRSLGWTAILVGMNTIFQLIMTILCAYPLTYDSLKGRKVITVLIIFTMYFQAGTIPNFLLFRELNLLNNPMVMILPGLISVFLMIILRKFFLGIPESLKESAEMDGAGPMRILVNIYLPLSKPALATIGLMYAVGRWNAFTDAFMFMTSSESARWHPIQLLLFNIINNLTNIDPLDPGISIPAGHSEAVQAAAIVVAMVPILMVYPWLQKYFVQGVTLGAVKG